ncbi:IS3 family transposase [Schleiferilactobacillus harbinensis]|uniref:IS3 family transposase n=1 Tax=Schleiferilactobacillus harbinensis TaxID=304207 RepID=UPI0021A816CA|nr:IS3 family transposase [Schleiferilactobacillus harbinensis]
MCCQIFGIARSAYYKWLHWEPTPRMVLNDELLAYMKEQEEDNHFIFGARRLTTMFNAETEHQINIKRVRRIMQDNDIRCSIRQKRHDRKAEKKEFILANKLLDEEGRHLFHPEHSDDVWVTDCTELMYGLHNEHRIRLSGIKDLHDHSILAWEVEPTETAALVTDTFKAAIEAEGITPKLLHSDQGSSYTSRLYNDTLAGMGVIHSMSRPGTPGDNGPMESFWSQAKTEFFNFEHANTFDELIRLIEEYILRYNYNRRQDALDGMIPMAYRNDTGKAVA